MLGLRWVVSWIQLWWIVIWAVTFSVQPMPNALLWFSRTFHDTVRNVVSMRLSIIPSPRWMKRTWSIQTWLAVSIWTPSRSPPSSPPASS